MTALTRGDAGRAIPLVVLSMAHVWLFQTCVSAMSDARAPSTCSSPPLSTLGLLALSFVELTRGSRVRGAIALVVVAIPLLLNIVSEVIN